MLSLTALGLLLPLHSMLSPLCFTWPVSRLGRAQLLLTPYEFTLATMVKGCQSLSFFYCLIPVVSVVYAV